MKILTDIIDSLVGFIQRNPLTLLFVLVLTFAAPSFVQGIALFVLYGFLFLLVLAFGGLLYFRYKVRKMQKQMRQKFDEQHFGGQGFAGNGNARSWGGFSGFDAQSKQEKQSDGDVKVYRTSEDRKSVV